MVSSADWALTTERALRPTWRRAVHWVPVISQALAPLITKYLAYHNALLLDLHDCLLDDRLKEQQNEQLRAVSAFISIQQCSYRTEISCGEHRNFYSDLIFTEILMSVLLSSTETYPSIECQYVAVKYIPSIEHEDHKE